jgi:hypothetical protein
MIPPTIPHGLSQAPSSGGRGSIGVTSSGGNSVGGVIGIDCVVVDD